MLPKSPMPGVADPPWLRELKSWCNDVVRYLAEITLQGDGKSIRINGRTIISMGTANFSGVVYLYGKKFTGLNSDSDKPYVYVPLSGSPDPYESASAPPSPMPADTEIYTKSTTFGDIHVTK